VTDLTEVRILIVDDNAAWRRFLVEELQKQSIQVVGTAEDGLFAIEQTRVLKPSVILMDVWMPRLNGLEATRAIGKFAPAAQVLMLTNNDDAEVVQAALAAGARGYLLKSFVATELTAAVTAILNGSVFIGSGLTEQQ
jgi:Response regulator containing a CheY-like receiver domain and an HTH DNA-binding domain